jgi:hypothetical protein
LYYIHTVTADSLTGEKAPLSHLFIVQIHEEIAVLLEEKQEEGEFLFASDC